jgi:hypothetical protein
VIQARRQWGQTKAGLGEVLMSYLAASYGVSTGIYFNAPMGGEFMSLRRIKPLSSGGLKMKQLSIAFI